MRATGALEPNSSDTSRMPLARSPICATEDLDEARDVICRLYYPHRLDIAEDQPLDLVLNAAVSGSMTLGFCTFGADA
ncbi:hypothetical protein, partial [Pseudonocardia abyssalis]|nr:hypothetical protein [Pseudonocardia abyssalis]